MMKKEAQVSLAHHMELKPFGYFLLNTNKSIVTNLDSFMADFQIHNYYSTRENVVTEYVPIIIYSPKPENIPQEYFVIRDLNGDIECKLQNKPGVSPQDKTVQILNVKTYERDNVCNAILDSIKENEKKRTAKLS